MRMLEGMALDEAQPVSRLPWMGARETHRVLVEWNATDAEYARECCFHELFEAHAERTPSATAVVFGEERVSYGELNARANRLAHRLRGLGVGPDVRVGLCQERSVSMVVSLLAVLKAGGAYVPLDPTYPAERLGFMVEDSRPGVLLVDAAGRQALSSVGDGCERVQVDEQGAGGPRPSEDDENVSASSQGLTPSHLAYVIYTSGSTGRPKGVMNEHRGLEPPGVGARSLVWRGSREPGSPVRVVELRRERVGSGDGARARGEPAPRVPFGADAGSAAPGDDVASRDHARDVAAVVAVGLRGGRGGVDDADGDRGGRGDRREGREPLVVSRGAVQRVRPDGDDGVRDGSPVPARGELGAHRSSDRQHAGLHPGRPGSAGAGGGDGGDPHRGGGPGPRVSESRGADGGALRGGPVQRRFRSDVQDGGPGALAGGRGDRVPGSQRRPGEGSRVPDRARGSGEPSGLGAGGDGAGGAGPGRRAGRPSPGGVLHGGERAADRGVASLGAGSPSRIHGSRGVRAARVDAADDERQGGPQGAAGARRGVVRVARVRSARRRSRSGSGADLVGGAPARAGGASRQLLRARRAFAPGRDADGADGSRRLARGCAGALHDADAGGAGGVDGSGEHGRGRSAQRHRGRDEPDHAGDASAGEPDAGGDRRDRLAGARGRVERAGHLPAGAAARGDLVSSPPGAAGRHVPDAVAGGLCDSGVAGVDSCRRCRR